MNDAHPLILPPDDDALTRAAEALRAGKLVGMPTETVYGLACNALDPDAVASVFHAKQRPSFDPLIVHLHEPDAVWEYAADVNETARQLAAAFWPGPLTLVMPKADAITDLVTSGLPNVGLRVPAHPIARQLIQRAGVPVAAPSANPFSGISPTRAEHVVAGLGEHIDCVIDGGPCDTGVESTVVSVVGSRPAVLRVGGTTIEQLEHVVGQVDVAIGGNKQAEQKGQASPGMLSRHYAPRTPLALLGDTDSPEPAADKGLLAFSNQGLNTKGWGRVEVLTPQGDLRQAAANLFAAMRRLDDANLRTIIAQPAPNVGLGRAINDRLRRAATSH